MDDQEQERSDNEKIASYGAEVADMLLELAAIADPQNEEPVGQMAVTDILKVGDILKKTGWEQKAITKIVKWAVKGKLVLLDGFWDDPPEIIKRGPAPYGEKLIGRKWTPEEIDVFETRVLNAKDKEISQIILEYAKKWNLSQEYRESLTKRAYTVIRENKKAAAELDYWFTDERKNFGKN